MELFVHLGRLICQNKKEVNLLGEFECKVDAKGRILFPAALKKQIDEKEGENFVINRGLSPCLVLYTERTWEKITKNLSRLNRFDPKNQNFIRQFFNGANIIELDNSNRILISKKLLEYASIKNDVVLSAHMDKIEIWSKSLYEKVLDIKPEEFAALAETVVGNFSTE